MKCPYDGLDCQKTIYCDVCSRSLPTGIVNCSPPAAADQSDPAANLLCDLASVDFETNFMEIKLPPEIVDRGFHCGKVRVDLSDVIGERRAR